MRLRAPEGYDPEDEEWEFKPGSTVRVELRSGREGNVLLALSRVEGDGCPPPFPHRPMPALPASPPKD